MNDFTSTDNVFSLRHTRRHALQLAGAAVAMILTTRLAWAQNNNGSSLVIKGKDGWLFAGWGSLTQVDTAGIDRNVQLVARVQQWLKEQNIELVLLLLPDKLHFYADRLPDDKKASAAVQQRYAQINAWERKVAASGTRIVKVMLHISPEEQKTRLMERLDRPDKHWKYNPGDVDERLVWPQYMQAYQTVFDRTSTAVAPWHMIPANAKWYARLAVQELLLGALEDIDPQWPKADYDVEAEKKRLAAS